MLVSTFQIKMIKFPKRTLACIQNIGPYKGDSKLFGKLFNKVLDWAGPKGLLTDPGIEAISVYHDDPDRVPEAKQRISVGFTVPADTKVDGDIKLLEIPASEYVIGSFEILPNEYENAWKEVYDFIQKEQLKPDKGVMYESYKNDPHTHPEGKHLVDICVAVKSA